MIVIDASIAVKWFLEEPGSVDAQYILELNNLAAPDIVFAEVQNTLLKRWRQGNATAAQVFECIPLLHERLAHVEPTPTIAEAAAAVALSASHPIRDCLYIALAERLGAPLATSDLKLARLASESGLSTIVVPVET